LILYAHNSVKGRATALALKVALVHTLLGTLWIVFSDRAAVLLGKSVEGIASIQMAKGIAYVTFAGVMASLLVYRLTVNVLNKERQRAEAEREVFQRLAAAAEWRDDETGTHVLRVAQVSGILAKTMGLAPEACSHISQAAALHDIGKIGIDDDLVRFEGVYTQEQREQMQQHTVIGGEILKDPKSKLMEVARNIALRHHERWDGKGYPGGLSGEQIPVEARCVALADVLDALHSSRRYKRAWAWDEAKDEIIRLSGSHFDPAVVKAFLRAEPELRQVYVWWRGHPGDLALPSPELTEAA